MQYRQFGKTGYKVSALGFGCMRLPVKGGGNTGKDVDFDEVTRMIRHAIDNGVNYVDTAYPYHGGMSEVALGLALKDGYRQKVAIADKSPVFFINKAEDFDKFLDEQLTRLGVDHIDFYLLHSLSANTWRNVVLKFDLLDKAERAKKAGKIGHIGFSFHDSYPAFEEILDGYDGFEFGQIQLNYLDVEKQAGSKGLARLAEKGIGAVIMEPLMGGKLAALPDKVKAVFDESGSHRTPVQWALDWLWDMPPVSVLLSGMSTMQQVEDNLAYAEAASKLTDAERQVVEEAMRRYRELIAVPCTGCGYCMPCPFGVGIPSNFGAYNDLKAYDDPAVAEASYKHMMMWQSRKAGADSCIGCRSCEAKCPQQIEISAHMPKIAEAFAELLK
jgi:predicted aldo/keto reductase-like oxidoreductase